MNNITVENENTYSTIIIKNINNYSLTFENNDLIIKKLLTTISNNYISYDELLKKNLKNSQIVYVKIDNELIQNITKYKKLIKYIYQNLDKQTIINNTILNVSIYEINEKGYIYEDDIGLSIQGVDSKKALKEIINQLLKSNKTIEIKIKLKSKDEIIYRS
jgi:hypothetical protein